MSSIIIIIIIIIGLDDKGFESRQWVGIYLTIVSISALGPTHPPIQWVLGAVSLG
jgi:hypothetical protein